MCARSVISIYDTLSLHINKQLVWLRTSKWTVVLSRSSPSLSSHLQYITRSWWIYLIFTELICQSFANFIILHITEEKLSQKIFRFWTARTATRVTTMGTPILCTWMEFSKILFEKSTPAWRWKHLLSGECFSRDTRY